MSEESKKGRKLKGLSKRRGTNVAMSDETKADLAYIQKKMGGVSRSEAIAQVIERAAQLIRKQETPAPPASE